MFVSIIPSYFSILLYNNNPESFDIGSKIFTDTKEKTESDAKKVFTAPKTKSTIEADWGEEDE